MNLVTVFSFNQDRIIMVLKSQWYADHVLGKRSIFNYFHKNLKTLEKMTL